MKDIALSTRRASQNQVLFRELNDGLRVLSEEIDGVIVIEDFVCECVESACSDHVALTFAEYEALREVPTTTRFAVNQGHVHPAFDRIIEEHDGYTIVEKRVGGGVREP
jgi:hypothetical protein